MLSTGFQWTSRERVNSTVTSVALMWASQLQNSERRRHDFTWDQNNRCRQQWNVEGCALAVALESRLWKSFRRYQGGQCVRFTTGLKLCRQKNKKEYLSICRFSFSWVICTIGRRWSPFLLFGCMLYRQQSLLGSQIMISFLAKFMYFILPSVFYFNPFKPDASSPMHFTNLHFWL